MRYSCSERWWIVKLPEVLSTFPAIRQLLDRNRMIDAGERRAMIDAIQSAENLLTSGAISDRVRSDASQDFSQDEVIRKITSNLVELLPGMIATRIQGDIPSTTVEGLAIKWPELYRVLAQVCRVAGQDLEFVLSTPEHCSFVRCMAAGILIQQHGVQPLQEMLIDFGFSTAKHQKQVYNEWRRLVLNSRKRLNDCQAILRSLGYTPLPRAGGINPPGGF